MANILYQKDESIQFYEKRYEKGYMEEWPAEKKQRVFEIVRNLHLPETGYALDFGCGNGVFTDVLRQALPNWTIYGCDISHTAIENARSWFSACNFFVFDDQDLPVLKFDFLFSHHVLEHVYDIRKVIHESITLLKDAACILHVFPCGNEGSFEHKICSLRKDGINEEMENRFFFEDEGHVRRLTTDQTNSFMVPYRFHLTNEFYSNQFHGSIKWISQSSPRFILRFTNSGLAINASAFWFLIKFRFYLLFLFAIQLPANIYTRIDLVRHKQLKHYLTIVFGFIPFLLSYPFLAMVNHLANKEWDQKKHLRNGSEMYLFYKR